MKYCIFVERIFDDECFESLKEFIKDKGANNIKLFCLTPVNYYLAVAEQGYRGDKDSYSRILADRYHILEILLGTKIELHLHLGLRLDNLNQGDMHKEAFWWMWNHGFRPSLITYGWYIYDKTSLEYAEAFNLKYYNDHHVYSFHDYEWDKRFVPMMIITNLRGLLR